MFSIDTSFQYLFSNATAVQTLLSNATAVQTLIAHNDVLQQHAKTLYATVSTSKKWVNNGFKNSDYPVSFSYPAKTLIFTTVGGYSSSGTVRVIHPDKTIAGNGTASNLAYATQLDMNNLIVTFTGGQTQAVSGDDYCLYEAWTLKE